MRSDLASNVWRETRAWLVLMLCVSASIVYYLGDDAIPSTGTPVVAVTHSTSADISKPFDNVAYDVDRSEILNIDGLEMSADSWQDEVFLLLFVQG